MREVTRLVVRGWPSAKLTTLEGWLLRAANQLKERGEQTKFLTTPGGFSLGKFPKGYDSGHGWDSSDESLTALIPSATRAANKLISPRVMEAADGVIQYITLNVDLRAESTPLHAELIAVVEIPSGEILGWTGKSYPTMCQEKQLVHVTDPKTHLFQLGQDRVVVLGCHDLNIFNGRARANQKPGGPRHQRSEALLKEIVAFRPTHILQHPHGTDTWRSWNQSWTQVQRQFPGVVWASGITYAAANGKCRATIGDTMSRTHYEGNDALNLIFRGRKKRALLQMDYVPAI